MQAQHGALCRVPQPQPAPMASLSFVFLSPMMPVAGILTLDWLFLVGTDSQKAFRFSNLAGKAWMFSENFFFFLKILSVLGNSF